MDAFQAIYLLFKVSRKYGALKNGYLMRNIWRIIFILPTILAIGSSEQVVQIFFSGPDSE